MTHPLLTPRYMVEADYPNSPYAIGDMLLNYKDAHYRRVSDGYVFTEQKIHNYPHIFRLMHWSEQRDLGEMPRYLRRKDSVIHVEQYYNNDKGVSVLATHSSARHAIEWYTPATEAEYLEYLKLKEK